MTYQLYGYKEEEVAIRDMSEYFRKLSLRIATSSLIDLR
jgi:hypothetical protein